MDTPESTKTTEAESTETTESAGPAPIFESAESTETTEAGGPEASAETKTTVDSPEVDEANLLPRKNIAIRLLFTLFFVVAFEVFKVILWAIVLFQYIYLFITRTQSESLRNFCNKISVYAYRVFRYMSLNENDRPFPFAGFPEEMEPAEEEVHFQ
jgi:hypothetical protein